MISVGIIAEFNPFHKGHARMVNKIREAFTESHPHEMVAVVTVMSGNFVQRGELACLPKGYRAEAAIRCGFDLALELPYPYSSACAEKFAEAGVFLLARLGVDYIAFGSETGEIGYLERVAERLSQPEFEKALGDRIAADKSRPYAEIRDGVYADLYGELPPASPNDILGVAYLTAMKKYGKGLKTLVIKREGNESATASRGAYRDGNRERIEYLVPKDSLEIIAKCKPVSVKILEKAVLAFLRLTPFEALEGIADMPVGLAPRLCEAAKKCNTLEEFFEAVATKSYTNARIRRVLLFCLFGVEKNRFDSMPAFTRLLGASEVGRRFLQGVNFPVLTRKGDHRLYGEEVREQVAFADRADGVYALADENPPVNKPFIL